MSRRSRGTRAPQRRGSILILTVWGAAALSLLAGGLGSRGAAALDRTRRVTESLQARYEATTLLQQAIHALSEEEDQTPGYDSRDELRRLPPNGQEDALEEQAEDVPSGRWSALDEESKISLNHASPRVLFRLAQIVGELGTSEAEALRDAILDWRDPDKEQRDSGAEDFYYTGLSPAYECQDGPFQHPEELLLVKGMSAELYNRLKPYVTTYSNGRVNLNTAESPVLRSLGLSVRGTGALEAYRVGEDRQLATADDRVLYASETILGELAPYMEREDLVELGKAANESLLGVMSEHFAITVDIASDRAFHAARLVAMADRRGRILLWDER